MHEFDVVNKRVIDTILSSYPVSGVMIVSCSNYDKVMKLVNMCSEGIDIKTTKYTANVKVVFEPTHEGSMYFTTTCTFGDQFKCIAVDWAVDYLNKHYPEEELKYLFLKGLDYHPCMKHLKIK